MDGKPLTQETAHIKSKRFSLIEKENFIVDLEYNQDFAIIHLPKVTKFTRSIYLDFTESLTKIDNFLRDFGYQSIWVACYPEDTSTNKLAKKMGFEYRGSAENLNVYEREL